MTRRSRNPFTPSGAAARAGRDALAIATGAPQVIATRLARMAAHGANPSPSERREMHRMVDEKTHAFGEAWMAMGAQSMRMQQAFWQTLMRSWWQPWSIGSAGRAFTWPTAASPLAAFAMPSHARQSRAAQAMAATMSRGVTQMAAAGLAPLSRRVRSNVTRLAPRRKR
jgi:hypothetical protein